MTDVKNALAGSNCVMAIAAHPDDVELGCSGVLMMEKRHGKKTVIIDLTQGELGTRGTAETRRQEAKDASALMGLDARENLELPDGFFQNDQESQLAIVRMIRKYRPEIVLTNAPEDRHPDHGRAALLVKEAAFLSGLRKIETELDGEAQEPWRPAHVFHFIQDRYLDPDFVYDITPVLEQKVAAIKAYKTQFDAQPDEEPQTYISKPSFLQSIIARSAMFGKMIGVEHAEGFITEKMIGIDNFDYLVQNIT